LSIPDPEIKHHHKDKPKKSILELFKEAKVS